MITLGKCFAFTSSIQKATREMLISKKYEGKTLDSVESRRFLNIQYGGLETRIKVLGMEDLSELQVAIKERFGPMMTTVGAPQLLIYDQNDRLITDLGAIIDEDTKTRDSGGVSLIVRTVLEQNSKAGSKNALKNIGTGKRDCLASVAQVAEAQAFDLGPRDSQDSRTQDPPLGTDNPVREATELNTKFDTAARRFLNVASGGLETRIKVVGVEDLSEIQVAIKESFGDGVPAPSAQIELYDQDKQRIKTWSDFCSLSQDYFTECGASLTVQVFRPVLEPTLKNVDQYYINAEKDSWKLRVIEDLIYHKFRHVPCVIFCNSPEKVRSCMLFPICRTLSID